MEPGNTIVIITLIMISYVLLADVVDGVYRPVAPVSPPTNQKDPPSLMIAFVLLVVPLILAALIGAVERQYIAWRTRALPSYARDTAC